MKDLPQYYLSDAIGLLTTRWIPLPQSAIDSLLSIIDNTEEYGYFIPFFAGITIDNSYFYIHNFPNDDNFQQTISTIPVPNTLFDTLDYFVVNPDFLLDSDTITDIFNILVGISEYASYMAALAGITTDNSQSYTSVINTLIQLPLFNINARNVLAD
jgi:hypothetical protein